MIKKIFKYFLACIFAVGMFAVIAININLANSKRLASISSLTMQNLQALSGESDGFDCFLKTMNCSFTATISAQITVLKKLGFGSAQLNIATNITDATQIYYKNSLKLLGDRVRCGTDVTCNDVIKQIMGK
jgi:hypothetical protein